MAIEQRATRLSFARLDRLLVVVPGAAGRETTHVARRIRDGRVSTNINLILYLVVHVVNAAEAAVERGTTNCTTSGLEPRVLRLVLNSRRVSDRCFSVFLVIVLFALRVVVSVADESLGQRPEISPAFGSGRTGVSGREGKERTDQQEDTPTHGHREMEKELGTAVLPRRR